ncbi:alpha/beta fold hydrolase [Permianibacter sp. IMCC34836]|uniref:YheT family hydrolase n=1 Tax=Permianibacter fluminis TaxID=2738515 RepID=UPI001551AD8F|nr:alpha/beta fold hydrolase [Permianibacter fluminis]NQD35515.1 alpha/beta fold hydrolase [Permianibacter fluminis]
MTDITTSFAPRGLLRNPHLQGVLSRLPPRRARIETAAEALRQHGRPLLLHGGAAQLLGWLSQHPAAANTPRPLVILLHGWEGSSDSLYLLATASQAFQAGFDVLRLNLRDHGDSHHLNPELFHSCRDEEVALAIADAVARLRPASFALAGFSLGGNFAMRVSLRLAALSASAQSASTLSPLRTVVAVCPVISPAATLQALETGPLLYRAYFLRKWKESLYRKAAVYPGQFPNPHWQRISSLTELTAHFVEHHTEYPSLLDYLNGYAMTAAKLAALPVNTHVIVAADDPVIPVADWLAVAKPPQLTLEVTPHGGHCGFVSNWALDGWSERRVTQLLAHALAG